MSGYSAFIGKEIKEQLRTYKVFVWLTVMLLFGIMSPVLGKFTPELMKYAGLDTMISLPAPVFSDSYAQFFKNISQMGFIILIILFSGIVANEKSKGTTTLMLTKKMSRTSFLLSKFTAMSLLWTVGYMVAALTTIGYTYYLFADSSMNGVFFSLLSMWLYGELLLSIILLTSSMFSNLYLGMFGTVVGCGILLLTGYIPKVKIATPLLLYTDNMLMIQQNIGFSTYWPSVLSCVLLTAVLVWITCLLFKRQEL